MCTAICAQVQIDGNTHGKVMSNSGVKHACPLSPILLSLHIDKLETYLSKIDKGSPCLFNIVIAILIDANHVVILFKWGAHLRRLLNKLYEFFTIHTLEVNLTRVDILIFGCYMRRLNQKTFLLRQRPNWDYPWIQMHWDLYLFTSWLLQNWHPGGVFCFLGYPRTPKSQTWCPRGHPKILQGCPFYTQKKFRVSPVLVGPMALNIWSN